MSLQRKVLRNQLKNRWREYNKGVKKKYRISFSDYWKDFIKRNKK